jgi:hypothetical protein
VRSLTPLDSYLIFCGVFAVLITLKLASFKKGLFTPLEHSLNGGG